MYLFACESIHCFSLNVLRQSKPCRKAAVKYAPRGVFFHRAGNGTTIQSKKTNINIFVRQILISHKTVMLESTGMNAKVKKKCCIALKSRVGQALTQKYT